jgi:DEAD/DEAH box helicase domain-containing protein
MSVVEPRIITFDIETQNQFSDVGSSDPAALDIALVAIHDSETGAFDSFVIEELPRLWKTLEETDILVGFNSDHFDIPLLNKYYPGDLSTIKSLDLLKEVHESLGRRIKLDTLAEATLGENKSAHGLQAIKWWREGNIDAVRKYCIQDVAITEKLFRYALEHKSLKYKDLQSTKEIRLNTKNWLTPKEHTLTHTLGF